MAKAQYHTERSPDAPTFGDQAAALAEELGRPLFKWQRDAVDTLLEYHDSDRKRPEGSNRWLRPEAALALPRQSGKSYLMLLLIAFWGLEWEDQTIILVAPDRGNAARRLEDLASWLGAAGKKVKHYRGTGNERLEFLDTGSSAYIVSSSRAGGHGESPDLVLVDEAWSIPEFTVQALVPAQSARQHWFRLQISTAGDEDSIVWNRIVSRGREAVEKPESRMTYVEYSAPPGVDVLDPKEWRKWHPAIGESITEQTLWDAGDAMGGVGSGAWLRAYGNISTRSDESVFRAQWAIDATSGTVPEAPEKVVIGVDVSTGPEAASVVAAWLEGESVYGVLVEHRIGKNSKWVVQAAREALEGHPGSSLAFSAGPTIMVKDALEAMAQEVGAEAHDLNMTSTAGAAMRIFEHVRDGDLTILDIGERMRDALLAARPKAVGDRWRFDRSVLVDQSPLIAMAAAVDIAWVETLTPEVAIW